LFYLYGSSSKYCLPFVNCLQISVGPTKRKMDGKSKTRYGSEFQVCPGRESDPYFRCGKQDFKSCASTSSATRATSPSPSSPQHLSPFKDSLKQKIPPATTDRISGAEDEARTRDLNLGKVALYQLSYFRMNFSP
jgi:hypothetical protein